MKIILMFLSLYAISLKAMPPKSNSLNLKVDGELGNALPNAENPPSFDVGIRRDLGKVKEAGTYFTRSSNLKLKSGFFEHEEEDDDVDVEIMCDLEFTHQTIADDMENFLEKQADGKKWRRNHLAASAWVLVFDKTDEGSVQLLEGVIQSNNGATSSEDILFCTKLDNKKLTGYNYVDFMSSSLEEGHDLPMEKYNYLYKSIIPLQYDSASHGDRLALDVAKSNPHLFFELVKQHAHREDVLIISAGMRYYSSYDACDPCFREIFNGIEPMKKMLFDIGHARNYHFSRDGENFNFHPIFYGAYPYTKEMTCSAYYTRPEDEKRKKASNLIFDYKFFEETLKHNLIVSNYTGKDKGLLSKNLRKNIVINSGDITLQPGKVYSSVKYFERRNGEDTYTIPYTTDLKDYSAEKKHIKDWG